MGIEPGRLAELRRMPYADYLASPEWQAKRKEAIEAQGGYCQVCRSRLRINIHHNSYERRGEELLTDLIVLCEHCHGVFHEAGCLATDERQCEVEADFHAWLDAFGPEDRVIVERLLDDPAGADLDCLVKRTGSLFDLRSAEGSRKAAEWLLGILARLPTAYRAGLEVAVARVLDTFSEAARIPCPTLHRRLAQLMRSSLVRVWVADEDPERIQIDDLDPIDREIASIVLSEPRLVGEAMARVQLSRVRDEPLRAILRTCFDIHLSGSQVSVARVSARLADGRLSALIDELAAPLRLDPRYAHIPRPPVEQVLAGVFRKLDDRDWSDRLSDLKGALDEVDRDKQPDEYRAIQLEYRQLMNKRPRNIR